MITHLQSFIPPPSWFVLVDVSVDAEMAEGNFDDGPFAKRYRSP
jgi:hypothetical protein